MAHAARAPSQGKDHASTLCHRETGGGGRISGWHKRQTGLASKENLFGNWVGGYLDGIGEISSAVPDPDFSRPPAGRGQKCVFATATEGDMQEFQSGDALAGRFVVLGKTLEDATREGAKFAAAMQRASADIRAARRRVFWTRLRQFAIRLVIVGGMTALAAISILCVLRYGDGF